VTDFGFDAFALDPVGEAGEAHPLEIARDLIANGKPRSALDVLSEHHEALADDPEYLLLCSEAWRADGDALRAQQALLGAARLAPEDPRPLRWLAELFAELGQHDKATRVRAKAEQLESRTTYDDELLDSLMPEEDDDLIAVAQRQERSTQAALTPKQVVMSLVALGLVSLLVFGIAKITSPDGATEAPREPLRDTPPAIVPEAVDGTAPIADEAPAPVAAAVIEELVLEDVEVTETVVAEVPEAVPAPAPTPEAVSPAPAPAVRRKPSTRSKRAARSRSQAEAEPKKPDPKAVQAELASLSPAELATRGEALEAEGHTGIAATYYRRALELDPDYAPALVGIGGSTLRAKKYSEAMRNATRALELARGVDARPGLEAKAIYQLGRVHYERGERDAARHLLRQSISLPGTPAAAWFYLGEALSSDNSRAAREAYQKYLELVPDGHLSDRARRAIQ
jgi:tetratricopeptide (TPR) repeat protein